GRRIKCLTCVDDFTKECLTVTVAFGISGVQVSRILDSIALFRGYPATIRTDQGPEFTCRARGARRIRKKSYAKVFRASVRAETSRLPVCGSAARRNRRLG
ncbi:integrase catalytic domain-containing protein, partial [Klebsiella pneumoniae]|uniref:integrase catalytic domain-containing protein n=3 Tax=Enterobacterales TaxID=91347 RepID=UPI003857A29F